MKEKQLMQLSSIGMDIPELKGNYDTDERDLSEVLDEIISDSLESMEFAEIALGDGNMYDLEIQMCRLKETCDSVGLDELSEEFSQIEYLASEGNLKLIKKTFPMLKSDFVDTINSIEDIIQNE